MNYSKSRRAILPLHIGRSEICSNIYPKNKVEYMKKPDTPDHNQNGQEQNTKINETIESDLFVLQMRIESLLRSSNSLTPSKNDMKLCFRLGKEELQKIVSRNLKVEDITQALHSDSEREALVKLAKERDIKRLIDKKRDELQRLVLEKVSADTSEDETRQRGYFNQSTLHKSVGSSQLGPFFSLIEHTLLLHREVERLTLLLKQARKGRLGPLIPSFHEESNDKSSETKVEKVEYKRVCLRLEASEKQLIKAQCQLAELQKQIKNWKDVETKMKSQEEIISRICRENQQLEFDKKSKMTSMLQLETLSEKIKKYSEDLKHSLVKQEELKLENKKLSTSLSAQEGKIKSLKQKISSRKASTAEISKELEQLKEKNKMLENEHSSCKDQIRALTEEHVKVKNIHREEDLEKKKIQEELCKLSQQNKSYSSNILAQTDIISKLEKELLLQREECEMFKERFQKSEAEFRKKQIELKLVQGDLKEMKSRQTKIEDVASVKIEEEKKKSEALEMQICTLKESNREKEAKIKIKNNTIKILEQKEEKRRTALLKPLNDDFETVLKEEMRVMKETFERMIEAQKDARNGLKRKHHEEIENLIKEKKRQESLYETRIRRMEAELLSQRERITQGDIA